MTLSVHVSFRKIKDLESSEHEVKSGLDVRLEVRVISGVFEEILTGKSKLEV